MNINQNVLIFLCFFSLSTFGTTVSAIDSAAGATGTPSIYDASNMTYYGIYEKNGINLKEGMWTGQSVLMGGASRPRAGLIKDFTFTGDIGNNGIEDRVVFLWESTGGTGSWLYMAIIGNRDGKLINLATHLIGDRVQLIMGRVNQGKIELDVIQTGKGDAACCPTSKTLRTWSLGTDKKNHKLIEHKPQVLGHISLADLEGIEWTMTQMNWHDTLAENAKITMTFKDDKISGGSGCNRYFASVKTGEMPNDITFSQAGGTRMACPGDAMKLETRFLKALSSVNKYSFVNGQLALTWKNGDEVSVMLFKAQ